MANLSFFFPPNVMYLSDSKVLLEMGAGGVNFELLLSLV